MPVIPALRKLRQEDLEFKASLGYTVRPCPPAPKKKCVGDAVVCVCVCL
jgi:hypothetical protein